MGGIYLGVELLDLRLILCFNFLGTTKLFLDSRGTILHSHQQFMMVQISPHLHQHLLYSNF